MLALAVGWTSLAAIEYRARDPDSRLYAEISARMAVAPPAGWIAPEFPPGWYMSGAFREHPVGLFLPAAALAALGYPAAQAAYAMNAVYQVLAIVLTIRLAATLAAGVEARALGWLIQLLPIAFVFRIRANHEMALLVCLLAALYGTERARRAPRFVVLTIAGLVGLLLVKGLFAVFGPALCIAWLVAGRLRSEQPRASDRWAWLGIATGVAAMGLTALGYEWLYRQATGEPFWSFYMSRQIGVAAVTGNASGLVGLLYNLVWYLARVAWFPFPASVFLLVAAWPSARAVVRKASVVEAAPNGGGTRAGAFFTAAVLALYVGVFGLSDRRADRYIFPVYYAVGAAGGVAALRLAAPLLRLARRLDRAWVPPAVWAVTFAAHLCAGRIGVPTLKFWAP